LVCNPLRVAFDNVAEWTTPCGDIFLVSLDDAPQPLTFVMDVAGDPGLFSALPEDASKFALQADDFGVFLACMSCEPHLVLFSKECLKVRGLFKVMGDVLEGRSKCGLQMEGCHLEPVATLETTE
jgi:hypothetical protein